MRTDFRPVAQELLYSFPYHYLPQHDAGYGIRLYRQLAWGLEYITYLSFIVDLIVRHKPRSLLDVGCGDGRLIHMIGSNVPQLAGVDLSEQAIAFARAFNPNIDFRCADIADMGSEHDWVTVIEVLEHVPDEDLPGFIAALAALVKSHGRLLISVPTTNVPLNRKHYRHYDLDLLSSTIAPHFVIEEHWWLYRRGLLERLIRTALSNRFFLLSHRPLLALLWRIHRRFAYLADRATGAHLVCLARPVMQDRPSPSPEAVSQDQD